MQHAEVQVGRFAKLIPDRGVVQSDVIRGQHQDALHRKRRAGGVHGDGGGSEGQPSVGNHGISRGVDVEVPVEGAGEVHPPFGEQGIEGGQGPILEVRLQSTGIGVGDACGWARPDELLHFSRPRCGGPLAFQTQIGQDVVVDAGVLPLHVGMQGRLAEVEVEGAIELPVQCGEGSSRHGVSPLAPRRSRKSVEENAHVGIRRVGGGQASCGNPAPFAPPIPIGHAQGGPIGSGPT